MDMNQGLANPSPNGASSPYHDYRIKQHRTRYHGHIHSSATNPHNSSAAASLHGTHQPKLHHDLSYYRNCMVGGVLSSSLRWVLTPLDAVKCNMQVHPHRYPTLLVGIQTVFSEAGVRGLYRGLVPTMLSYSHQTGIKYAMYEWNKDQITNWVGHEKALEYKSLIYLTSSGMAEAVADVFMCPWEIIKVQMQTSTSSSPPRLGTALLSLLQQPTVLWASLGPLWGRQIAGTMANFFTFEHAARGIYRNVLQVEHKRDCSISTQLTVTLAAGYISGLVSTIVSHPADSLFSLKGRHPDRSMAELVQRAGGWQNLATKGLGPRIAMTGSIIAYQWLAYDSFKSALGMGTTGG